MTNRALGWRARRARIPFLIATLAAAIACGDVLEPSAAKHPGMALAVARPTAGSTTASVFGAAIDTVYVLISRPNESIAAETTVAFPATDDALSLKLDIDLTAEAETLWAYIEMRDGSSTLWYGSAELILRERTVPKVPEFALTYIGPGYDAVSVTISPRQTFVGAGFSVQYGATAYNGQGQPVPAPIGWNVSDPRIATVDATGYLTARAGANGVVRVRAFTPTGVADSLDVNVSSSPQVSAGPPR
jgi:hypothetical protein